MGNAKWAGYHTRDCNINKKRLGVLKGKSLKGAPFGNHNAAKPTDEHRKNATFKLSPKTIELLKNYPGNKSRLIENLLIEYFNKAPY